MIPNAIYPIFKMLRKKLQRPVNIAAEHCLDMTVQKHGYHVQKD